VATSKRGKDDQDKPKTGTGAGRSGARVRTGAAPGRTRRDAATTAASGERRPVRAATGRPRLNTSHAEAGGPRKKVTPGARPDAARPRPRPAPRRTDEADDPRFVADRADLDRHVAGSGDGTAQARVHGNLRKAPLTGPRRALPRKTSGDEAPAATRELALVIAAAGMDKKALGIEILDVSGKVDYADFLVIMTGRSDRHVHAIATGLEEEVRKQRKVSPLSMEGLTAATWVLIDFGDVVVHVFQEEARRVYDIEGLWIDANRVPVPENADGPGSADYP
jgi:ribosome-associated protein